jgi:AraC family ethanolamine operon transcriptional activator
MARQPGQYQYIVDQVLRVTRRRPEEPIRIANICRNVGVSARTLLRAFRAVHGATPYRYLCSLRLLEARRILSSATGDPPPTVTEVATHLGFAELGRFSVAYRSAFGECPSDTLRRSPRSTSGSTPTSSPRSRPIEQRPEAKRCAVMCGAEE